jgi:alkylation response protein AidB-like acyl-CoA dehydrogenase
MQLDLNDDQRLYKDSFERFFAAQSTPERVRAAEPLGFDPALWRGLAELGALPMRAPEAAGGGGAGLMEAVLLMEQAGKRLASAPLAEAVVAARLLGELGGEVALSWLTRLAAGDAVVTLALYDVTGAPEQIVPGGAVADAVLALDGDAVVLFEGKGEAPANLGSVPLSRRRLSGARIELAQGETARSLYLAGLEEWKLLTAATLAGIAGQALEMAAAYSNERVQFGKQISAYQGLSHPLANLVTDNDGAQLLVWWAVWSLAAGKADAAATVSMAYWWAARTAGEAVAQSLHTYGGYGLSLEYDIQLYHRRAKALALTYGNPDLELDEAGRRLWLGRQVALPAAGDAGIDFGYGEKAKAIAAETRAFFESYLTPELRESAHHSWEGHDWGLHRALGEAKLLFPDWPIEHGGRGADPYEATASQHVWDEYGWTINAVAVSSMVGFSTIWFGTDALQREVLPRIASGEVVCCLGYSEPGSGSDIFAAKTRAVRDGDDWVIQGQKMWTSGANLAAYVLLLTRTDPEAPKHKGITMFLVPMNTPGIEVTPIYTYPDERTNVTFYTDVRIPDRYRLGKVNGGLEIMTAALRLEQGGAGFIGPHRHALEQAVEWAKTKSAGKAPIEDESVRRVLARVATKLVVSDIIFRRSLFVRASGGVDLAYGPMSKLFSTEAFLRDSTDLLDLTAPYSLLKRKHGLGVIESAHRHAAGTTIYGGTSEVQRSQVAEKRLGMARSR